MSIITPCIARGTQKVYGQLFRLACPILFAHIIESIIPFMNLALAGRQGPLSLAAAGLAGGTFATLIGFGGGIIVSVGIITSYQLGQSDDIDATGIILKSSLWVGFLVSLLIMGLMKMMQPLWLWFGQSPEVAQLGQDYLDGLSWLVFADLAKFSIFQFTIAHHKPRVPVVANLLSVPLIGYVNYVLVSHLGLYGLGLGTALVYWLVFLILWGYLYWSRSFRFCLRQRATWQEYLICARQQLQLGVPMGLMLSIELLFSVAISILMGRMSTDFLVAHQIAIQWLSFTVMVMVGFSEAITILISKARWNAERVLSLLKAGLLFSNIAMLMVACLYWFSPYTVIRLDLDIYNNEHAPTIALAVSMLTLCGFYQVLDGIQIVLSGGLRGLADTRYPLLLTLIAFWGVGLPMAWFCAFILGWKSTGLWIGMILAQCVMISLQYHRLKVIHKVL